MKTYVVLALFVLAALPARSQEIPLAGADVPLPADLAAYSEDVALPEEVIGHRIGERHTTPPQVRDYFRRIAAASEFSGFGEDGNGEGRGIDGC